MSGLIPPVLLILIIAAYAGMIVYLCSPIYIYINERCCRQKDSSGDEDGIELKGKEEYTNLRY